MHVVLFPSLPSESLEGPTMALILDGKSEQVAHLETFFEKNFKVATAVDALNRSN